MIWSRVQEALLNSPEGEGGDGMIMSRNHSVEVTHARVIAWGLLPPSSTKFAFPGVRG